MSDPALINLARKNRLYSETMPFTLEIGDGKHDLAMCIAYDITGAVREINMVSRGKIGHGLDLLLHDLGIKISRGIQGRDPDTGRPL